MRSWLILFAILVVACADDADSPSLVEDPTEVETTSPDETEPPERLRWRTCEHNPT